MAEPMHADELRQHLTEIKELLELIVALNYVQIPIDIDRLVAKKLFDPVFKERLDKVLGR